MKTPPFFSIIIPIFRARDYIARCIESCIYQSFQDFEIILIDDCGQDGSIQIVQNHIKNQNNIIILHNSHNKGTFLSRIHGIKYATGNYTLFLDADDALHPNACDQIYQCIQSDFNRTQSYADIVNFGLIFKPKSLFRKSPAILTETLLDHNILETFFLKNSTPPWNLCTKAFKTSILNQSIIFFPHDLLSNITPLTMAEDALHFFVIAMIAKKSIGINQDLYFYTQNPHSITQRTDIHAVKKKQQSLHHTIDILKHIGTLKENQTKCKKRFENILKSVIELENRYQDYPFAYLKACLKSLKYHQKWQTLVRIFLFLISFGKIKL